MLNRPLPPLTSPGADEARWLAGHVRDVLARLQVGPFKDRWPGGEGAPDLIVCLQRAAPLLFAAVRGCAETHGITLPLVVEAHVGSELFSRYKQDAGMAPGYSFMLLFPEGRAAYVAWLDRDPYVQQIIAGIKAAVQEAGAPPPRRVMIHDDILCEYSTSHAASYMVQRAFPTTEIEFIFAHTGPPDVIAPILAELHEVASWLTENQLSHIRDFLWDLAKGYLERPTALIPLQTREQIQEMAIREDRLAADACRVLLDIYGEQGLLALPQRVRETIHDWGRSIDLRTDGLPSPAVSRSPDCFT